MTLRVNVDRFFGPGLIKVGVRLREDELSGRFQIAVEIDRTDQSFITIGQSGSPFASAARLFAASHHQILPKIQRLGPNPKGVARNQPRAKLRQLALGFASPEK